MHAIRLHAFGPAENLTYEDGRRPPARPRPGPYRRARRPESTSWTPPCARACRAPCPSRPPLPTIPGREVAGVVESLGEGVAALWLGKRVVAHLGFAPGGYAELAVTDVDRVHEIPGEPGLRRRPSP